MRIIDIQEGKITITPEALCISPFSELWQGDKSKDKSKATSQMKYIWFFADIESPYYDKPEADRHNLLALDVMKDKDYKVTKEVNEGIKKYQELYNSTPGIIALDAAYSLMFKIQEYFKTVDLQEVDVKKLTDTFSNMPKIMNALQEARRVAFSEKVKGVKIRGGAELGLYE